MFVAVDWEMDDKVRVRLDRWCATSVIKAEDEPMSSSQGRLLVQTVVNKNFVDRRETPLHQLYLCSSSLVQKNGRNGSLRTYANAV